MTTWTQPLLELHGMLSLKTVVLENMRIERWPSDYLQMELNLIEIDIRRCCESIPLNEVYDVLAVPASCWNYSDDFKK